MILLFNSSSKDDDKMLYDDDMKSIQQYQRHKSLKTNSKLYISI